MVIFRQALHSLAGGQHSGRLFTRLPWLTNAENLNVDHRLGNFRYENHSPPAASIETWRERALKPELLEANADTLVAANYRRMVTICLPDLLGFLAFAWVVVKLT